MSPFKPDLFNLIISNLFYSGVIITTNALKQNHKKKTPLNGIFGNVEHKGLKRKFP